MTQGTKEMEYKYDAFISYRHAEKDTKIASEIQQSLERFRIPSALRKQTGKERFNRVFRDVEELPISSNLTEDLTEALRLSQYLIVICSFRTSESDWVRREIETFLELHDYNKQLVFTVLVEGEPDEVIPEILRHDNITHYLADGTFYCKDEVVEPLAADYRMPISKARKTELPRLAASMLGCNYDDIIRRRKAFRRRRLLIETAVISIAAIALLTYIGWMMMKIQDNLRNAQINQSIYLSSESTKLLNEGDRVGAMRLALAALEDSDGTRRPVTSEARYALASALGAYHTMGTAYSAPVWRYETDAAIVKYECNRKGERVAILDVKGNLNIWNTKDHKLVTSLKDDNSRFILFDFDKDDNLITATNYNVTLYEKDTWKVLWQYKTEKNIVERNSIFNYYSESGQIAVNCKTSILILDSKSGELVEELDLKKYPDFKDPDQKSEEENKFSISTNYISVDRFTVSSDLKYYAMSVYSSEKAAYSVYLIDKKNEKCTCLIETSDIIQKIGLTPNNSVILMRRLKEDRVPSGFDNMKTMFDHNVSIEMFTNAGKHSWQTIIPTAAHTVKAGLYRSGYTFSDGKQTTAIIASFANKYVIIDEKNGKIIKNYDLLSYSVLPFFTSEASYVIASNGSRIRLPDSDKDHGFAIEPYFMDGVVDVVVFADENNYFAYLVEDSSKKVITEYSSSFYDSTYKPFEGADKLGNSLLENIKCGKYVVSILSNGKIACTDVDSRKVIWIKDETESQQEIYSVIKGAAYKDKYVFLLKKVKEGSATKYQLAKLDCETGQLLDMNKAFSADYSKEVLVVNDKILTFLRSVNGGNFVVTILTYKMSDDTVGSISSEFPKKDCDVIGDLNMSPDEKKAFIYLRDTTGKNTYIRLEIDTASGKATKVETRGNESVWNEKGTLFAEITDEGSIDVYSASSGKLMYSVESEMQEPLGAAFNGNSLYVIYENDLLCGYNAQGKQILNTNLGYGGRNITDKINFEFKYGYLFITRGSITDFVNLTDGKSIAYVWGFIGLHSGKDNSPSFSDSIVICKSIVPLGKDKPMLGYFDFKTTNRLIEQAKEYLKNYPVSNEFKVKYSLN